MVMTPSTTTTTTMRTPRSGVARRAKTSPWPSPTNASRDAVCGARRDKMDGFEMVNSVGRHVSTHRPSTGRRAMRDARCAREDVPSLSRAVEVVDSSRAHARVTPTHAVGDDGVDDVVVVDIIVLPLLLRVDGGCASFADALGLRTRDRGVRTRRTRARTYIERIAAVRSRVCDVDDRATHGFIGLNTKPTPRGGR